MSASKRVVQRYLDALVAGDVDTVRDSFAEDATWTIYGDLPFAGPWHGRDRIVDDFLTAVGGSLFEPGSQSFEFPTLLADGDTVALEWRVHARTPGAPSTTTPTAAYLSSATAASQPSANISTPSTPHRRCSTQAQPEPYVNQ